MLHKAYVFDAYGTLFDVHSAVARHRDAIGPQADRLSQMWRTKQLEYTWTRTLMGAYRDFRVLTAEALDFAAGQCGGISPPVRAALLEAYERLEAYDDVKPALEALKAAGAQTAILSNGTPAMLASAMNFAGIAGLVDACLSVDALGAFKTVPAVYALATRRLGVGPADISFQSSNRWDVAGAVRFGCHGVWINRTGQPDEYADLAPERVLSGLGGLLAD